MGINLSDENIFYKEILVGKIERKVGWYYIKGFQESFKNLDDLKVYFKERILADVIIEELNEIAASSSSSIIFKTDLGDYYVELLKELSQSNFVNVAKKDPFDIKLLVSNGLINYLKDYYQITEKGQVILEKSKVDNEKSKCKRCGRETFTLSRSLCPSCYTTLITADDYKRFH